MPTSLSPEQTQQAISLIRGMAMDAPLKANSGHQGTAMALAPLGHVLYSRVMKHDPADPEWPDRDRFVLSNGHASILQYTLLYLSGYGLELDDLKQFRQFESRTPGHPEARHTAGVEVTTGPLGQGFADAVGMAIAERILRTRFGKEAIDHHTFVIAGDGCMMEGVSHEAASLAGHLGLGRLICVYDDNRITIDGPTSLAFSDDTAGRFAAYGWDVHYLGEMADDLDGLTEALQAAKADDSGRPHLLVLRSHIGYPSPDHTDDFEAHGLAFDAEDVTRTKAVIGIPDEPFWSPPELVAAYRKHVGTVGAAAHAAWTARSADVVATPEWQAAWSGTGVAGWTDDLPTFELGTSKATRQAIQATFEATVGSLPGLVAGAADLTGNTGTKIAGQAQPVGRGSRRASDLLRRARARDGSGAGRHGDARRDPPRRRHVLRVLRLHAPADPPGRAVAGQGGLRVLPRLGRRRRGRADPPTRRAARRDQGDPRAAGDPPGRCQRDRRGVEGHRRARRPDGAGPEPPGHQGRHRRLGRRARRRDRVRTRSTPRSSCCSPPAARSRCASTPRRSSPATTSRRAS